MMVGGLCRRGVSRGMSGLLSWVSQQRRAYCLHAARSQLASLGQGSVTLQLNQDGIAILTLDNPAKRNAVTGKMMVELSECVERLAEWQEGKAVVVRGAEGGGFCSGADLDIIRQRLGPQLGQAMTLLMSHSLTTLSRLPILSLAFIQPPGAYGGGAEICMACDLRVISENASIGFVHSRLGVVPAWGGAAFLKDSVGHAAALRLIASGCLLKAPEVLTMGLVQATVTSFEECLDFLRKIVPHEAAVIRKAKAVVMAGHDEDAHRKVFQEAFLSDIYKNSLKKNIKHKD